MRCALILSFLLLTACPTAEVVPETPEPVGPAPHVLVDVAPCEPTELRDDGSLSDDDRVAELLAALDLDRSIEVPRSLYEGAGGNLSDDPTRLEMFHMLQEDWTRVPCFAGNLALRTDRALDGGAPLAMLVADAALALELDVEVGAPFPSADGDTPLATAIAALFDAYDEEAPSDLAAQLGDVPLALRASLATVLYGAIEAAQLRDEALDGFGGDGADWWFAWNGNGWMGIPADDPFDPPPYLNPDSERDAGVYLRTEEGAGRLHQGGVRLAEAVDAAGLESLRSVAAGVGDLDVRLETPLGRIVLGGTGDDSYVPSEDPELDGPILLFAEFGGADTYAVPAGANVSVDNPVAVHIDFGGADQYGFEEVADPNDDPRLLPSDAHGRRVPGDVTGPYSLSRIGRQGSGRLGYGFLLDLGTEPDRYRSHRQSQGWGGIGVGLLYDAGGDDTYEAEQGAQGAAIVGTGLLIDRGGDDRYKSFKLSQGFGMVSSYGALHDEAGNDDYELVVNDIILFDSPQTSGSANSSLGQGCAFGWRRDNTGTHLGGGLALLRDRAGDDTYQGATFVQGAGYWMGLGVLADADGADMYDGVFYAQGATAHFALAAFLEGGGDDSYGQLWEPRSSGVGLAHDWSVTVFVEDGGDDVYRGPDRSMGASKCHGLSIFTDNGGDDVYEALHDRAIGWATDYDWAEDVCGNSDTNPSYGFFVDVGGTDTYIKPDPTGYGNDMLWITDDPVDATALELSGGLDAADGRTWTSAYGAVWEAR